KMPIEGHSAPREATLSETQVCASRPSGSFVVRAGAPQLRTMSSYVAPCHEPLAEATSPSPPGVLAQPARKTSTAAMSRIAASCLTDERVPSDCRASLSLPQQILEHVLRDRLHEMVIEPRLLRLHAVFALTVTGQRNEQPARAPARAKLSRDRVA